MTSHQRCRTFPMQSSPSAIPPPHSNNFVREFDRRCRSRFGLLMGGRSATRDIHGVTSQVLVGLDRNQ
jgi:hypothetical protein